ncbi:MAG: glycerate kinase [Saprospiraceae bacterium]|nr:glycerate kinase [Saprospiraceae bacterium]
MQILIACDSFKDALPAFDVCRAIQRGIEMGLPKAKCRIFPMSDGGEGLIDILTYHLGLEQVAVDVCDPLFRKTKAHYNINRNNGIAFIEMAQAAGLELLTPPERNPMFTTTYGVGELILHAIDNGAKKIVVGLGGSATNDGGIGMADALGFQFIDSKGNKLKPVGENLQLIDRIIPSPRDFQELSFEAMSDVYNPLIGPSGAAYTYGPQKGASASDVARLDEGLRHLMKLAGKNPSKVQPPGYGAAGGLGFGVAHFLGANLRSGIDMLMDMTGFDDQLDWADIILTGEGRIDNQTASGKLISGIAMRKRRNNKPLIAFCGAIDEFPEALFNQGLTAFFPVNPKLCTLEEALADTRHNLTTTAFNVASIIDV